MELDDSRNRIYISNLEDELSEIESDEEKLVFLPEIERRLTKIPRSVLTGRRSPPPSNEVVLYNVPESLTVPKELDGVRKAIIETRQRARDKHFPDLGHRREEETMTAQTLHSTSSPPSTRAFPTSPVFDEDAMDLG